ncbi:Uncharacterised protein [Mycobacteroides abscessus]|nr:Uncharacterised protein [Mycobacteroides abscessus]
MSFCSCCCTFFQNSGMSAWYFACSGEGPNFSNRLIVFLS